MVLRWPTDGRGDPHRLAEFNEPPSQICLRSVERPGTEWTTLVKIAGGISSAEEFDSNGGGELFAIDMHEEKLWNVIMVPFIGMQVYDAILIADDFNGFVHYPGRELESKGHPLAGINDHWRFK